MDWEEWTKTEGNQGKESEPPALMVTDSRGGLKFLSPGAVDLLGLGAAGRLTGTSVLELFLPAEELTGGGNPLSKLGEVQHWICQRKDGRRIPLVLAVYSLPGSEDLIWSLRDLTAGAHDRALAELGVMAGRDVLWSQDLASGKTFLSPQAGFLLGGDGSQQPTDLDQVFQRIHPQDRRSAQEAFHSYMEGTENHYCRDFRVIRNDGQGVWVQARAMVLTRDPLGRVIKVVGSFRDITQERLTEGLLGQQMAELKTKNQELESFAYTVSHDLKSPLLTVKGFLGSVLEDLEKGRTDRVTADIRRIIKASDHMQALLEDLLEFSRIGRKINPPGHFSMEDCVRSVLENLTASLHGAQAEVRWEGVFPQVWGDSLRLGEVWQNLVENSIKYAQPDRNPLIILGARQDQGEQVFYVRDNGKGIPREALDHVFDLFTKLDAKSEGTGIGLALVRKIVEFHRGRVWAESGGRGEGTTVLFTLGEAQS